MHTRTGFQATLLTIVPLFVLLFLPQSGTSQPLASWEDVPREVRERKAFKRFEWFHRQRAHPDLAVPVGALETARELEMAKEAGRPPSEALLNLSWSSIGPAGVISTYPSWWGVVSGRVRALAVHPTDPNTVYIGPAAGGIWKTTDAGVNWQDVGVNLASLTFGAIAIDPGNPQVVYAGSGESIMWQNTTSYNGKGLYKTTNGGASWTQITSGFGTTTHFSALKVSPTNSNVVFAALGSGYWYYTPTNEGLWRSTNAGVTWTQTLNVTDGFDVLPHPTTAGRVYGATGGGVSTAGFYRSTDNGANWTKITSGLPTATSIGRMQIGLCTSSPSTVYALVYSTSGSVTLYKSTNDGTNWVTKSGPGGPTVQGWYDLMVAVHPTNPLDVYIGTENLEQSTDSGSTFSYVGGYYWNQSMHVDFHIMAYAPSNPLYRYVGCDGGIYRSTNGGISWGQLNSALPTLQYYRIGSHPTDQNTITGGSQDNGVFKTTNGGSGNWTLVSTGDGMECFYDYSTPTTVYASTQYGALVKSTSGGGYGSFTSIQPSTTDSWAWTAPFFIHPTTSSTIYTASQRPWRSTNGGGTWTDLYGVQLTTDIITTMAQSPVTPNNMILAASEGVGGVWPATPPVYVSTNGGTIWTNVTGNIGGTARYITRVLFHPTQGNTCYVVRSGYGSGNKIYRSTNMGTNWTSISGDLPDVPHNDLFIDPAFPSEMYAANDLGVYQTTNGGTNWTRQGNGMPYVPAIDFDYFNSGGTRLLRAATHGRAAYQASLTPTASLQVTIPNGGEVWPIGSGQTIQWNSSGFTGNVAIDLSRNGGGSYESLVSSTANDGLESWTVTGAATPLGLVRVSSVDFPSVRDSSNSVFNVIQVSLTVTTPNGGETWIVGQSGLFQWTSLNMTGNVRLELSRNGGATWDTVLAITPDDGTELWPITGSVTTQALVRVVSLTYPWVSDTSNSVFAIVQPSVSMIVPNGGETWTVGSAPTIQWSSAFHSGPVRLELSRDGGVTFGEVLFPSTADDGLESWPVTAPATTTARIRVVSVTYPWLADTSAANFTITQPQLSLLVPNGGEVWAVDSVRTFQWNSSGLSGTVTIELSRNGGASYETVAAGTANDGSESWTVTAPATTQARARITSDSDPTVFVVSTADFAIVAAASVTHIVNGGWNMLSVPVTVPDLRPAQVFPGAVSAAFAFSPAGYVVRDTLRYGEGYWLKHPSDDTLAIGGGRRDRDTVGVVTGWNMIGSISTTVRVDSIVQIPDSIVRSSYYSFIGLSYVPLDSLEAMRGYWIKVSQSGRLVLKRVAGPAPGVLQQPVAPGSQGERKDR